MTTVFHRVGPYEIHEEIGRGGMAVVFLATDTLSNRQVALKLVSIEADRDGQQVLEAERWGAKLQEEFCRESRYVPVVFEHGTHGPYFYIAMEHLSGRNLSEIIAEGPMPVARAVRVATQLCEFLQAADAFERTLDGRQFNLLLHGDLKPRNIRVLDADEIKIFDFGIAKALSLSRKVTRNDFGSIAYLSPERLESGEIDAQAELWAVGVLLYEMISGVQPFRAADTRRLEHRIRVRQPPETLDGACPAALQAIVAKLLAADVGSRYPTAAAIRDDLERFSAGDPVHAVQEGWPAPQKPDEATRRTHRENPSQASTEGASVILARTEGASVIEDVTRRTVREPRPPQAASPASPAVQPTAVTTFPAPFPLKPKPRGRIRRFLRNALLFIAIAMVLNEIRIHIAASALADSVPQELAGVVQMWNQYRTLSDGSLNIGISPLDRALTQQSILLSDRTFTRYRTPGTTVYEREWQLTRDALSAAVSAHPSNQRLEAALRYAEGHLSRIEGETRARRGETSDAQEALTAAVTAFRRSAEARQDWPDPFLGLMRTFIALDDIERGADALAQAERYGYVSGTREWAQLGEGYLARAAKLAETDELELLNRAADAYTQAVDYFSKAIGFGNAARRLRDAQRGLRDVQDRIERTPFFLTPR